MRIDSSIPVVPNRMIRYQSLAAVQLAVGLQRLTIVVKDQDQPNNIAETDRQIRQTKMTANLSQTTIAPIIALANNPETEFRRRNPYVVKRHWFDDEQAGIVIDLLV